MKFFLKINILIILVLSQSYTLQALQRRAGTVASRGYFTRTGTSGSFASETSSRTPITCPNAGSRSNYFGRGSWKSGSTQQRPYHISKGAARIANLPYGTEVAEAGWKAGRFAARHKGKLLAAGTAGATYGVAKHYSEKEKRIELDLQEFRSLLKDYNKESYKKLIVATIQRLKDERAINRENESFDTPLLMVIKADLSETDKADIIKLLVEHGAKPSEKALVRALGFSSYVFDLNDMKHRTWPELKDDQEILKIILPYYDKRTLLKLIDIVDDKIDEIKKFLTATEMQIEQKKQQISILEKEAEPDKIRNLSGLQKDVTWLKNQYEINKPDYTSLKQLKNIALKSLYKGQLLGTAPFKEEAELK